jgi:hypothetical protein
VAKIKGVPKKPGWKWAGQARMNGQFPVLFKSRLFNLSRINGNNAIANGVWGKPGLLRQRLHVLSCKKYIPTVTVIKTS